MRKKPVKPSEKREVLDFARHLERSINRLGRQKPKAPPILRRSQGDNNQPPDAA